MKKYIFLSYILSINFLVLNTNLFAQSNWSEDMRLTFDYAYSADPKAACDGDTIHLVWWKNYLDSLSNYRDEVFYKRSTDAGVTWGDDVRLTPEDSISAVTPNIAVWGGNVHIVWKEQTAYYLAICYRRSENGGNTWGDIDTILKTDQDGWYHPWISVNGNNVFLVTIKSGSGGQLIFVKSIDNGNSWLPTQEITTAKNLPRIENSKFDSLFLSVTYNNTPEIYNVRSFDGGQTWLDSQLVSEGIGSGSQEPAMDTDDSSGVHIIWYDYKYSPYPWTGDIFYRASRDSGNSWEEIDSLTVMHRAVTSDILAESNSLHLVWDDDRHGFDENREIYYRMSNDLGEFWEPEVRLTRAPYHSRRPSLACDGNFLHLFWSDQRDSSNTEPWMLYYKRKDLVGINEETVINTHKGSLILECPTILTKRTSVYYDLGSCKNGDIMIMDVTGRLVDKFPVHQSSGYFVFHFNRKVCDGIYFIMLRAEEKYTTKKVLVLR